MLTKTLSALSAACLCSGVFSVFSSEKNEGMSRFLRFVFSLCLLASLLSPAKELAASLPKWSDLFSLSSAESLSPAHASYRYEQAVSQMLCGKFSLSESDFSVAASVQDGLLQPITVSLTNSRHAWLESDIKTYLEKELNCEVTVYAVR